MVPHRRFTRKESDMQISPTPTAFALSVSQQRLQTKEDDYDTLEKIQCDPGEALEHSKKEWGRRARQRQQLNECFKGASHKECTPILHNAACRSQLPAWLDFISLI